MNKLNCWEFKQCGRGPNGKKANKLGACPIASESSANGLNGGTNGGRICWVIADVQCQCGVKCSDYHHKASCLSCEFCHKVLTEEGLDNVCRETGSFLNNSLHQ